MRLKEFRKRADMTQADIAKLTGKTVASISRYENGQRRPSINDVVVFADIFGCTVDELLRKEEKNDAERDIRA